MENTNERSPWLVVLLVLMGGGVGLVFGSGIGGFAGMQLYEGEGSFLSAVSQPTDAVRVPMYAMQAISSLFSLLIVPALVWWRVRRQPVSSFFRNTSWQLVLLICVLVIAFAFVDSVIIQWNKNLSLPAFLRDFETWAQAKELELERLTHVLVAFASPQEFLMGFLVIAVLAGVCEEFFFRGLLQPEFARAFKNPHAAIWLTAALFSAVHVQFYGFFPRMLLGALFGYLYWWSGNLWIPMLAHAVNNGFSLVMMYLHQENALPLDVENESVPWPIATIFLMLTIFLLQKVYRTLNPRST